MAEPTEAVPQVGLRVVSFVQNALNGDPGKKVQSALVELVDATVKAGFPEEKAKRAVALWLIDAGWTHLMRETQLIQESFFAITTQPLEDVAKTEDAPVAEPVPGPADAAEPPKDPSAA